jgi:hypothetical protein
MLLCGLLLVMFCCYWLLSSRLLPPLLSKRCLVSSAINLGFVSWSSLKLLDDLLQQREMARWWDRTICFGQFSTDMILAISPN